MNHPTRRRVTHALLASLLALGGTLPALAQPDTPAKILVGFPAGGSFDAIARIVADTEEIYRERIPIGAAFERIERLYRPFHAALADLLERTRQRFGMAVLIDCHSMPSASMNQPAGGRPHFVLGDRFGASCDAKLTRFLRDLLQSAGYEVQLNRPYAGGFITEYYGNPARGVQTLQLEINRALYLNETTLARSANFDRLAVTLNEMAGKMFAAIPMLLERRLAAE